MPQKLLRIVVEYTFVSFLGKFLRHWTESQLRTRHLVCNLGDELVAENPDVARILQRQEENINEAEIDNNEQ